MQFENETTETGNRLSDEIAEAQQKKWKTRLESTDFTHSSRKEGKTINKLWKDYAQPQQQYKVTVDQVAHQLLLNGRSTEYMCRFWMLSFLLVSRLGRTVN